MTDSVVHSQANKLAIDRLALDMEALLVRPQGRAEAASQGDGR